MLSFCTGGVMCCATLMVYVEADRVPEQRIRLIAHLADTFNAALIGLTALAINAPLVVDGVLVAETTAADIKGMRAKPQASPHFSGVLSNKRIKKTESLSEKNRNPPIDGEDRHERPERIEYWLTV
jgi:hypothetical protein